MRSFIIAAPLFALGVFAQASNAPPTVSYSNPMTSYTTQTNSLGVVTGMPAADTSIPSMPAADTSIPSMPAEITSQPALASIPAGLTSGINTVTALNKTLIVSESNSTTTVIGTVGVSSTMATTTSGSGMGSGSGSGSSTMPSSTKNAAAEHAKVAGGALIGAGALFAALL